MNEPWKATAAKILVPVLAGLLVPAFIVGKAFGGDGAAVELRLTSLEAAAKSIAKESRSDHDLIIQISANVAWLVKDRITAKPP